MQTQLHSLASRNHTHIFQSPFGWQTHPTHQVCYGEERSEKICELVLPTLVAMKIRVYEKCHCCLLVVTTHSNSRPLRHWKAHRSCIGLVSEIVRWWHASPHRTFRCQSHHHCPETYILDSYNTVKPLIRGHISATAKVSPHRRCPSSEGHLHVKSFNKWQNLPQESVP